MKRWVACFCLILTVLAVATIKAQDDCGDGLPCGRIPWDLPQLPALPSPTPMPTVGVTINPPTQTPGGPTATATSTPPPTELPFGLDFDNMNDQMRTLQAAIEATEEIIVVSGTPMSNSDQLNTLADNSSSFFGYVRGVSEFNLGGLTPLLTFVIVSTLVVFGVKSITFILPVLLKIFTFIKGIIDTVIKIVR